MPANTTGWVNVEPQLRRRARTIVRSLARRLLDVRDAQELSLLKEHFFKKADASGRDAQALRVSLAILFDLSLQGWKLEVAGALRRGKPPVPHPQTPRSAKRPPPH